MLNLFIPLIVVIFLCIEFSCGRKLDIRKEKSYPVKVISTNTRSGFVDVDKIVNSKIGSKLINKDEVPDNIYHGAIVAYGNVFDFIMGKGILSEKEEVYYAENNPIWLDGEFQTNKTEKEFMNWLNIEKIKNFTPNSYRLSDNNCLTFVQKAIQFLGGKEPQKLRKARKFALNNRRNSEVLEALYKAWNPQTQQLNE